MEDQVDILTEFGVVTGKTTSRKEAHRKGLWHAGVVVFIVSPDYKQVLLQKRSEKKEAWPGCWDVSAGGHLDAGEDAVEAVIREAAEELGLEIPEEKLRYIGTSLSDMKFGDESCVRHFNTYFVAPMEVDTAKLKLQGEEVADIKWVGLNGLIEMIKNNYTGLTRKDDAWNSFLRFCEKKASS